MDFLKKGQDLLNKTSGSGSGSGSTQQAANTTQQQPQAGQQGGGEDYGDKGLDFIQKKTGHVFSREQNEKITDGARGLYEKQTGNKIDPKYSN